MKKTVTIFTLFVSFLFYGQFTDNFETYTLGSMSNQAPTLWNTWGGDYNSGISINVSDTYAFSGTKSGYIQHDATYTYNTDAILNLGNKTSGKWQLTFKMYVPAGNSAYFWGLNELSSTGGYQNSGATLNGVILNTDGTGTHGTHSFTYPQGTWFDVVVYFNATNKSSRLTINGTVINSRVNPFYTGVTTVGGIDFYSNIATDNHYVDDFAFTELTGIPDTYVLPDANFEQALIDLGLDTNGLSGDILVAEAQAITSLDISNKNIASLEGIQHFTNLTSLNCSQNNITNLQMISGNTALQTLNCSQNSIVVLDVSANTALQTLNCSQNSIVSLNVSGNTALQTLNCSQNSIASLNVSANTALQTLNCNTNNLFDLILANGNNSGITTMNATNNTNLTCIVIDAAFTPSAGWSKDTTANYNTSCTSCVVTIPDTNFKNALVTNTNINTNGDTEIQCSEAAAYTGTIDVNNKNITNLTGIEAFTALKVLYCYNNQLTSLDVSANTALKVLYCYNNQLTSLDVSANTALLGLRAHNNQLTNLDVSVNTVLKQLWVHNNQLTSLNVANGNNANFGYYGGSSYGFASSGNYGLSCIQIDSGFTPNGWIKDAATGYSTDCASYVPCIVAIPDANLKSALLAHGSTITGGGISKIDTNYDGEIQCGEAAAYTGLINVKNKNITNATGIEAFVNLTGMNISENNLSTIDVSQAPNLRYLDVYNTNLTTLDLSNNAEMRSLWLASNNITVLDISHLTKLEAIGFYGNSISTINFSNSPNLKEVFASNNNLTSLDISNNLLLEKLYISDNNIGTLNVTNHTKLKELVASNIGISTIDVTNQPDLERLFVGDNSITTLNIANNPNLKYIGYWNNAIGNLDFSNKPLLVEVIATNSNTTSFSAPNSPNLEYIYMGYNASAGGLTLDVAANTNLKKVHIQSSNVSGSLYFGNHTMLTELKVSDNNSLQQINLKNGNTAGTTILEANNTSSLSCIQVDAGFTIPTTWQYNTGVTSINDNCYTCTNFINIPDANFKNALLAHGTTITGTGISTIDANGDGEICEEEAAAYTGSINVYNKNITNLTGIEAFTALKGLNCRSNSLTSLDVSTNTALTYLNCRSNSLTNLDVSTNTALTYLNCSSNSLTSLDVSTNTALTNLNCYNNQLTNLDVSTNTALISLYCFGNQLTSLDVSSNTALVYLGTSDNLLTDLDVSANTALATLWCNNNQLTSLNVANGNNTSLTFMRAHNNPSLVCIQHDSGFTPPAWNASTNTGWQKDDTVANWSDNCAPLATDTFATNAFVAYPNPVKDKLNLEYNTAITNVRVFNLLGQEVIRKNVNATTSQIDMTRLSAGTYIVKVTVNTIVKTIKVVKE